MFYKKKYKIVELQDEVKSLGRKLKESERMLEISKRTCRDYLEASQAERRRSLEFESLVAQYINLTGESRTVHVRSDLKALIEREKEKEKAAAEEALISRAAARVFGKWSELSRTCTIPIKTDRALEAPVEMRGYSPFPPKDPNAANTL